MPAGSDLLAICRAVRLNDHHVFSIIQNPFKTAHCLGKGSVSWFARIWASWQSGVTLHPEQPQPQDADPLFFRLV
jgi:hypothetical protein